MTGHDWIKSGKDDHGYGVFWCSRCGYEVHQRDGAPNPTDYGECDSGAEVDPKPVRSGAARACMAGGRK